MLSMVAAVRRALCRVGGAMALIAAVAVAPGLAASPSAVLSAEDAELYRRIFAVQEDGRWTEADRLIDRLGSDVLLGHVLFQRYMHPTAYRSKFRELQGWLAKYADHPGADRIYRLARKRGSGTLRRPVRAYLDGAGGAVVEEGGGNTLSGRYGGRERKVAARIWSRFWRALRRGHTLTAKRYVQSEDARKTLNQLDHDRLRAALAYAYFVDGRDQWALHWGRQAVEGSGDRVPLALWATGLASWRLGDVEGARASFARLAQAQDASAWLTAAGAYWAARASLRSRRPEEVSSHLVRAAEHPRTFYGLLARRALGLPIRFTWERDGLTEAEVAALKTHPNGHRALALVQVGKVDLAEEELRKLYPVADTDQREAVLRLADAAGMSALALHLAALRANDGEEPGDGGFVNAHYPVPLWEPQDGWRLDRALLFAFVRQESGFNPQARSWAGARGLMQMLPSTAAYIANDRRYRRGAGRNALHTPELNLALGQKYLEHLLGLPDIDGNLFFAAAAYNGGPGNLRKWRRVVRHEDDPLLFIESIPSRETRIYIERVLANLWVYRNRMGQPTPSLDMVVAGDWPRYSHLDKADLMVADRRQ